MLPNELDTDAVRDKLAALDGSALRERYLIRHGMRPIAALVSVHDLRRLETIERLFAPTEPADGSDLIGALGGLTDEQWDEFHAELLAIREETRPVEIDA